MSDVGALATLPDPTLVEEKNSISFRFSRRTVDGHRRLDARCVAILAMAVTFFLPEAVRRVPVAADHVGRQPERQRHAGPGVRGDHADEGLRAEIKADTGLELPAETIRA